MFLSNEDVRNLLSWSDVVNVCEKLILERANGTAWFAARERWVLPTGSVFLNLPGGGTEGNFAGTRIYSQQANAM
ncbi:MAG: hypothetical protein M1368_12750, partial [Thaumarchaeota archaeon]|nr:hypothetical protein [Nitrososphaerota archaeon]